MIKNLSGTRETIEFPENSLLLCYDNTDYEAYPTHWHAALEIVMPLEGIYEIECGGQSFVLKERDVMIIPPGSLHSMHADRGRRIIFQTDISLINMFRELESFFSFVQPALHITGEEFMGVHEDSAKHMEHIFKEYFANAPMKETAICAECVTMLTGIARTYAPPLERLSDTTQNKQREYVEKFISICDYISAHCTEDLTLEQMAEQAGFSKYHFSRLFKEYANTTFYKYLNMRRIACAQKLLLDPEVSVMDAAVRSGFNSLSAFIRMFRIIKGCTPTEFRTVREVTNIYDEQS